MSSPTAGRKLLHGHEAVVRRLAAVWSTGRLAHAYLFVGPAGVGKSLLARRFAQAFLCSAPDVASLSPCRVCASCKVFEAGSHPDYIHIGLAANKTEVTIDAVRELTEQFYLKPALGAHRAAVVDDADLMNDQAANAFLKTLEEPPKGSLFLLVGLDEEAQLPTIISRCQVVRFGLLSDEEASRILLETGIAADEPEANRLAEMAAGTIEGAAELRDQEWQSLLQELLAELAQPSNKRYVLTKKLAAFCDAAGDENAAKRRRAKRLMAAGQRLFRSALLTREIGETFTPAQDSGRVQSLASTSSTEILLDLLERTLQAQIHVDRNLFLPLTIECWMDDLSQISAGVYVPAVGYQG